jgi:hypothetical protein
MKAKHLALSSCAFAAAILLSIPARSGAADGALTDDTWVSVTSAPSALNSGKSSILRLNDKAGVLLKWDLSPLGDAMQPGSAGAVEPTLGAVIVKATLRLYMRQVINPGYFDIYLPAADWSEETTTGKNRPAIDTGVTCCVDVEKDDQNTEVIADVAGVVKEWMDGVLPNYGLMLMVGGIERVRLAPSVEIRQPDHESKSPLSVILSSKESPNYCFPAKLEVTLSDGRIIDI